MHIMWISVKVRYTGLVEKILEKKLKACEFLFCPEVMVWEVWTNRQDVSKYSVQRLVCKKPSVRKEGTSTIIWDFSLLEWYTAQMITYVFIQKNGFLIHFVYSATEKWQIHYYYVILHLFHLIFHKLIINFVSVCTGIVLIIFLDLDLDLMTKKLYRNMVHLKNMH